MLNDVESLLRDKPTMRSQIPLGAFHRPHTGTQHTD